MNYQEVFTKIKNHLLTQNAKAMAHGDCLYKVPNSTLRCAIGCLFTQLADQQLEWMVGTVFSSLVLERLKNELGNLTEADRFFLSDLQNVHDGYQATQWAEELHAMAVKYKLTY